MNKEQELRKAVLIEEESLQMVLHGPITKSKDDPTKQELIPLLGFDSPTSKLDTSRLMLTCITFEIEDGMPASKALESMRERIKSGPLSESKEFKDVESSSKLTDKQKEEASSAIDEYTSETIDDVELYFNSKTRADAVKSLCTVFSKRELAWLLMEVHQRTKGGSNPLEMLAQILGRRI